MLLDVFENRNKTVWSLLKLSECLGRSLRENTSLLFVDSDNSKVAFLTESDKVIQGNYVIEDTNVTVNNLKVEDSEDFKEGKSYEDLVNEKIHNFVGSLNSNDLGTATNSFDDVLKLWESRLKFDGIKSKLDEKSARFDETLNITKSSEFKNLEEITPTLIEFLAENKDRITGVQEIVNAIKLSDSVSNAFDMPKISYEDLEESKSYQLKDEISPTVFDMICQQELVKKELIESKKSFDVIWATNDKVKELAGLIFEEEDKVIECLSEAIKEVPYLALVSKNSLNKAVSNALSFTEGVGITDKDIKNYSSKLFEMKKPVKQEFINVLNEEYGINIQNLKDPPSFKSLLNTQVVIFETLSRISPKNSLQKQALSEMSKSLKYKSGVESIDVNDYLKEVFSEAGYIALTEVAAATKKKEGKGENKYVEQEVKIPEIKKDLKQISSVFDLIKKNIQYGTEENLEDQPEALTPPPPTTTPEVAPEAAADPAAGAPPAPAPSPNEQPAMDVDQLKSNVTDLESLINDLSSELGIKAGKESEQVQSKEKKDKGDE